MEVVEKEEIINFKEIKVGINQITIMVDGEDNFKEAIKEAIKDGEINNNPILDGKINSQMMVGEVIKVEIVDGEKIKEIKELLNLDIKEQ
jgi:hypothetical protein